MSGGLEIRLPWGDGEYNFRLTLGGWRRVQDKCDAGPEEVAARLAPTVQALSNRVPFVNAAVGGLVGKWRVDDVREVIYQGLLGGKNEPAVVAKLMIELVDDNPIRQSVPLAFAIAMAGLDGVDDDLVGELEGSGVESEQGQTQTPSPERSSSSADSTPAAAERVSRRRKSTK